MNQNTNEYERLGPIIERIQMQSLKITVKLRARTIHKLNSWEKNRGQVIRRMVKKSFGQ